MLGFADVAPPDVFALRNMGFIIFAFILVEPCACCSNGGRALSSVDRPGTEGRGLIGTLLFRGIGGSRGGDAVGVFEPS